MKIIPERVTVIPDAQRNELTVIMEGFRLTLSSEEARTLSYALVQGIKQLSPDPLPRSYLSGTTAFSHKPAAPASTEETSSAKSAESGVEAARSLSA